MSRDEKVHTYIYAMEILIWTLVVLGILGAVLPLLPGPLMSAAALTLALFTFDEVSTYWFLAWIMLGIMVFVSDYFLPGYMAKLGGASKYASRGANIGLILGLLFGPGFFIGAIMGAFAGEFLTNNNASKSFKSALYASLGVLSGITIKVLYTIGVLVILLID
jgi:uncharacterized protein YqgC (DUF456 family)